MKRKPVAEIGTPTTLKLRLEAIRTDLGTQMRPALNREHVADLAELYEDGAVLPSLEVYHDGQMYILTDGFHRLEAMRAKGKLEAECEVHEGSLRDALLRAAQVNNAHGLRRDNATKRAAVLTLLQDEHWRQWSDREIARQCLVSHEFVRQIRSTLQPAPSIVNVDNATPATRTTSDGRQYPAQQKPKPPTEPSLEYLEQTASTNLSVEALETAWADWGRVEGLSELELKTALEANSRAFFGYLDGLRKQYSRRDVLEAAGNILQRMEKTFPSPAPVQDAKSEASGKVYPIEPATTGELFRQPFAALAEYKLDQWLANRNLERKQLELGDWYEFIFWLGTVLPAGYVYPRDIREVLLGLVNWELEPAESAPGPGFGDEPAQLAEREAKLGKVANSIVNQSAVDAVEQLEAEIRTMLASTYPATMHLEVLDGGAVAGILKDRGISYNKNQLAEAMRRVRAEVVA